MVTKFGRKGCWCMRFVISVGFLFVSMLVMELLKKFDAFVFAMIVCRCEMGTIILITYLWIKREGYATFPELLLNQFFERTKVLRKKNE